MYSLKPVITETKSIRNVKENVSCASSEIHLLGIGSKDGSYVK